MRIITGILLLIICFGSNSCQKELSIQDYDSLITTPPGSVTGSLTAKVDGVQFIANKATSCTRALNTIAIAGVSNDGQQLILRVEDSGIHVYTLDINSASNAGAFSKNNGIAYTTNGGSSSAESGGTLSVTAIDESLKTISGTFSIQVFRQSDSTQKIITEGVFTNISYATIAIPPSNSADTFRVKTDGVQFPVYSITGVSFFGMINLEGSDQAVSRTVGVSFRSDITPGTYTFTFFGPDYMGQYNIDSSYLVANAGTLTILEHNTTGKRIRGNFNFPAEELLGSKKAVLTEGYFSVVYQ